MNRKYNFDSLPQMIHKLSIIQISLELQKMLYYSFQGNILPFPMIHYRLEMLPLLTYYFPCLVKIHEALVYKMYNIKKVVPFLKKKSNFILSKQSCLISVIPVEKHCFFFFSCLGFSYLWKLSCIEDFQLHLLGC